MERAGLWLGLGLIEIFRIVLLSIVIMLIWNYLIHINDVKLEYVQVLGMILIFNLFKKNPEYKRK